MRVSAPIRRIIVIDFLNTGPILETEFEYSGVRFHCTSHQIGWDFEIAQSIIRLNDGFADGFALSGVQKRLTVGESPIPHPGYLKLLRLAERTPIYLADDVRDLFTEWTLRRLTRSAPHLLSGRRLLFQCASVTSSLEQFEDAGVRIQAADALIFTAIPKLIESKKQLERFISITSPVLRKIPIERLRPAQKLLQPYRLRALAKWLSGADGFVSFGALIDHVLSDEVLAALEGKLLIVDYLEPETRAKLQSARTGQIVELVPEITGFRDIPLRQLCIITALFDQCRMAERSPLNFRDYVLGRIQEPSRKPRVAEGTGHRSRPIRCAFLVHPLSNQDFFRGAAGRILEASPRPLQDTAISIASIMPSFHLGTLRGAVSQATGQEVICDIFALPATPAQILSMPEDFLYDRLIDFSRKAHARGAAIAGLGAYTKVAGDAGVTVARYSPIPITNGNSYSASTTLWAARSMIDRLGMSRAVPRLHSERRTVKAMIIGATGSIGRVSSLLTSLAVDELVLVAQRLDKLVELREEVLMTNPAVQVTIATQANPELYNTDLIVTATSNLNGSVLDISKVKPGAVICDCSRPLDISADAARSRPDVIVIKSGEVILPGQVQISCDIGLPKPTVYACLAETILLAMDGRLESFSLSKTLSMRKVKEIYKMGLRHGVELSAIQGHHGIISEEQVTRCRELALQALTGRSQNLRRTKINEPSLLIPRPPQPDAPVIQA